MLNRPILFVIILLIPFLCVAQAGKLKGLIRDAASMQPLAFVNVFIKETNTGVVTDIDGLFSLKQLPGNATLVISYVGYKTKQVIITKDVSWPLTLLLEHMDNQLENVIVAAGENPAHRIIRLVQLNKKENDPEHIKSFKYNAYTVAAFGAGNKFWSLSQEDSALRKARQSEKRIEIKKDTAAEKLRTILVSRFKENYLFLTESYTERIFRYPGQSKETVLATKISGLQSASFALTTANFQPFGFYKDYIQMVDKSYVNPIIDGSISLYKFKLKEVVPHEKDTTFIISFEPRKNRNFTGLKGLLYINSGKYAIENVIASPADEKSLILRFRLQQKYERIAANWFPVQLNSTIMQTDLKTDSVIIYWDTRSYISNVSTGQQFYNTDFSDLSLDYAPLAGKRTEKEWGDFRKDSLKQKEKKTYKTYQMLPAKSLRALNKINTFAEAMGLEAIPYGKVDIPFKYFITGINRYEKFRPGGGFQTNPLFNKWFSFGGYSGYGLGDRAWKYGGNMLFNIDERTATKLLILYSQDVTEPGNVAYFTQKSAVLSNQLLRNFYTYRMDSVQQYRIDFSTKVRPFFQTDYWLLNELRNPAGYTYQFKNDITNVSYRQFRNTEAGIGLRLTVGESFTKIGRAKIVARPSTTELLLQVSKGLDGFLNGHLQYTKLAFQLNHSFRLKRLGQTSVQLEAGQIWGDIPYSYLFTTRASRAPAELGVYIPNTFQTVGLYEFASDRSAGLFIQHNFGNLLYKPKSIYFRPELVLVQNIALGSLQHPNYQRGIEFKTPSKGLYESGLLINNLFRKNMQFFYLCIGGGVFFRYGYYSLPKNIDNWAFKFGINFSF